jgi:hypothetical protein
MGQQQVTVDELTVDICAEHLRAQLDLLSLSGGQHDTNRLVLGRLCDLAQEDTEEQEET